MMKHFAIETSSVANTEYVAINDRLEFHDINQWLAETHTVIQDYEVEVQKNIRPMQIPSAFTVKPVLAPTKKFTMQDVSKHRTKGDLFVIIGNEVFNVSSFLDDHP